MDSNIFYRVMLNDRMKIEPKHLSKTYRTYVTNRLKTLMEGTCTKHGLIKQGSIDVYKIAPGNIELISLNGSIVFDVYYHAEVCNPLIGSILKSTVVNVNKFGILAESSGILEIIIAKNSVNINHDSVVNLESIQIGQSVMVEVVGKKFELGDKKISIVGRIVSAGTKASVVASKKPIVTAAVEDDDEDVEVEVDEDDEDEDENENDKDDKEEDKEDKDDLDESLIDIDEDDPEALYQDGGNEFFDSDEEAADHEYEFYSEDEDASVIGDDSDAEGDF